MSFLIADTTSPVLNCPTETVIQYFNTTDYIVEAEYPVVDVTDGVGVASVTYSPPNGTEVKMRDPNKVTVTAWDTSGNMASCQFIYMAEREC